VTFTSLTIRIRALNVDMLATSSAPERSLLPDYVPSSNYVGHFQSSSTCQGPELVSPIPVSHVYSGDKRRRLETVAIQIHRQAI
jgi:hypothetical protein